MSSPDKIIPLLIPDMPTANDIRPWLEKIDQQRIYTNFGPLVDEFKTGLARELSELPGNAVSPDNLCCTASGTSALILALASLKLKPASTVLLPSYTFPASALAVIACGHRFIFADVDRQSWLLTPELASAAMQVEKIDAVLPVATFGNPVDCQQWDDFIEEHEIPVVVDAAAGFGNQAIGELGIYCFSFHATKAFGVGEGGLLVSRQHAALEECRERSNFGFRKSIIQHAGVNAKMSEYHAAVGIAQLARWQQIKSSRVELWDAYLERLGKLDRAVSTQKINSRHDLVHSTFNVTCNRPAQAVATSLAQRGISSRRWYSPGLHQHPVLSGYDAATTERGLETTEYLTNFNLGLPFHTSISHNDLDRIVAALEQAL